MTAKQCYLRWMETQFEDIIMPMLQDAWGSAIADEPSCAKVRKRLHGAALKLWARRMTPSPAKGAVCHWWATLNYHERVQLTHIPSWLKKEKTPKKTKP
jgi:hypothetical protein